MQATLGQIHIHTSVRRRSTVRATASTASEAAQAATAFRPAKPTLFDVPLSNNGARVRFLLYKKGLEKDVVDVTHPKELGGLKSPEYLALNPYGQMPLLVLPDGTAIPESQVIESYVLDKYKGVGPDLVPATPELRAHAALAARIHDLKIASVQGCMYKSMDSEARAAQLAQIAFQLDVLESLVVGPFWCGEEISYGDSALMPTFVFLTQILPRHFGWASVFMRRPKLEAWWAAVGADPEAARVMAEMQGGLQAWETEKRWQALGIERQVADSSYNWSCDS